MAKPEHVEIVKQGADAIVAWREAHRGRRLVLRDADLEGTCLQHAQLQGADLEGAKLQGVDLQGANLQHAKLRGVNLRDANLQGANLGSASLESASLQDANLRGVNLQGANLQQARLLDANLESADFRRANLESANLRRARLQGANLRRARLQGANLNRTNLQDANLQEAHLEGINLIRANLANANLRRARLQGARLRLANLQNTNLEDANLRDAGLAYTKLQHASLCRANLQEAKLQRAFLNGADLSQIYFNQHTNFDHIIVDHQTKGLGSWIFHPEQYILRELDLPPEYHGSSIDMMNYFSTILSQKYPSVKGTVQIRKENRTIRMIIETEQIHYEMIEHTLEEYGYVISGAHQSAQLLSNASDILQLENQLSLIQVRLEHDRQALKLTGQSSRRRIEPIEGEVAYLRQLVGDQLRHSDRFVENFGSALGALEVMSTLRKLLDRRLNQADEVEVKRLLSQVERQRPGMLQGLAIEMATDTSGDMNRKLLLPWIQEVAHDIGGVVRLVG